MVCGGWSGTPRLFPASRRQEFQLPAKSIARSTGHRPEWIQACKDKKPADGQGRVCLLGAVHRGVAGGESGRAIAEACESGDSAAMRATNIPEADALIRKHYRAGFGIAG